MTLDGVLLKGLLVSGYNNLCGSIQYLNDINVFPVSDGDTGTNMKKTYGMGIEKLVDSPFFNVVLDSFVQGTLLGARGNSGMILSQYFVGFYNATKDKQEVSVPELIDALLIAYNTAFTAVLKPADGTILTVMRESTVRTKDKIWQDINLEEFFNVFTAEILSSLKDTPKTLAVLKENNVVDSGGAGFYLIFDGFRKWCCSNNISSQDLSTLLDKAQITTQKPQAQLVYRYCTEFRVKLKSAFNKEKAVNYLEKQGDSIAIASDKGVLKVHIHTNNPDEVINEFSQDGELLDKKIDDMASQLSKYDYAVIGDSSCDLTDELRARFEIDGYVQAHFTVPSGEEIKARLDWSYMGQKEFFKNLKKNPKKYATAPANMTEVVEFGRQFLEMGKDILFVALSSKISGTYNMVLNASKILAKEYPGRKVLVVDSKKYSLGSGQLLIKATELRKQGLSIEKNVAALEEIKYTIHQMGTMDDLFFVASKGRISNAKAFMGTLVKIKTLGDFNREGEVAVLGKAKGAKKASKAVIEYIKKTIVNPKEQIIIVAHTFREKQAKLLADLIKAEIAPKEVILTHIFHMTGINTGPGLAAAYYFGTPITDLKFEQETVDEILENL